MTRWAYLIERIEGGESFARLNALGEQGWELVGVQWLEHACLWAYWLKRPCGADPFNPERR